MGGTTINALPAGSTAPAYANVAADWEDPDEICRVIGPEQPGAPARGAGASPSRPDEMTVRLPLPSRRPASIPQPAWADTLIAQGGEFVQQNGVAMMWGVAGAGIGATLCAGPPLAIPVLGVPLAVQGAAVCGGIGASIGTAVGKYVSNLANHKEDASEGVVHAAYSTLLGAALGAAAPGLPETAGTLARMAYGTGAGTVTGMATDALVTGAVSGDAQAGLDRLSDPSLWLSAAAFSAAGAEGVQFGRAAGAASRRRTPAIEPDMARPAPKVARSHAPARTAPRAPQHSNPHEGGVSGVDAEVNAGPQWSWKHNPLAPREPAPATLMNAANESGGGIGGGVWVGRSAREKVQAPSTKGISRLELQRAKLERLEAVREELLEATLDPTHPQLQRAAAKELESTEFQIHRTHDRLEQELARAEKRPPAPTQLTPSEKRAVSEALQADIAELKASAQQLAAQIKELGDDAPWAFQGRLNRLSARLAGRQSKLDRINAPSHPSRPAEPAAAPPRIPAAELHWQLAQVQKVRTDAQARLSATPTSNQHAWRRAADHVLNVDAGVARRLTQLLEDLEKSPPKDRSAAAAALAERISDLKRNLSASQAEMARIDGLPAPALSGRDKFAATRLIASRLEDLEKLLPKLEAAQALFAAGDAT